MRTHCGSSSAVMTPVWMVFRHVPQSSRSVARRPPRRRFPAPASLGACRRVPVLDRGLPEPVSCGPSSPNSRSRPSRVRPRRSRRCVRCLRAPSTMRSVVAQGCTEYHPDLPLTSVWGYEDVNGAGGSPITPGPTFVSRRGHSDGGAVPERAAGQPVTVSVCRTWSSTVMAASSPPRTMAIRRICSARGESRLRLERVPAFR
jgi:hypothetical protein